MIIIDVIVIDLFPGCGKCIIEEFRSVIGK